MRAFKGLRRGAHLRNVEPGRIEAHALIEKRIGNAAVQDLIDIFLLDARADGIEALIHLTGVRHGNIAGETGVERERDLLDRDCTVGAEVRAVAQGVHARVRAAAARYMDACTEYFCNGVLHGLLHRGETGLPLPAVIGGAVVSETECNVSQMPYLVRMIDPARISAQKARAR